MGRGDAAVDGFASQVNREVMASKIQIKLISAAGELLNVVTCFAGQVSVLRASSLNEVRPYQRALFGTSGPERFSISVDSAEYIPSEHTLIGFGENPPYGSLTAGEYLTQVGALEGAVGGALLALGLQDVAHTPCSALSPDQERRLRLLAATYTPARILILNEPFEPIASGWRERCADLLLSFARNQGGIVVVTHTSFRPESWIDNDAVSRIQVGQSSQRTVGFRARSATTTRLMQQLRSLLGSESEMKQLLQHGDEPPGSAAALGTVSGAVAATLTSKNGPKTEVAAAGSAAHGLASWLGVKGVVLAVAGAGAITAGVVYATLPRSQSGELAALTPPGPAAASQDKATKAELTHSTASTGQPTTIEASADTAARPQAGGSQAGNGGGQPATPIERAPAVVTTALLLDTYPGPIKAAILATVQGSIELSPGERGAADATTALTWPRGSSAGTAVTTTSVEQKTGNLFKLLEQASSSEAGRGSPGLAMRDAGGSGSFPSLGSSSDPTDESLEARREEIRRKFMESLGQSSMNR